MMRIARSARRTGVATAAAAAMVVTGAGVATMTAQAVDAGTIVSGQAPSEAVGTIDYAVYLPAGYEDATEEYASLYLLHGRGDTQAAWQRVAADLDELIAAGSIPPMIVVMPDAPWNDRGSWYTDSLYTGDAATGPGVAVETAFTRDLVDHVDATYRTVDDRAARAVGGYSMGGAGALRFSLAHQDTFSAGLILSPATYVPEPPSDSSARDYGAYGVGDALYDTERYIELSYPTALAAFDATLPVHLFIAVGDDEYANPDPADAMHDIDLESAQLYNAARRVPGITAELRVLNGGHDWDVWQPAFREGIVDIASYLRTAPPEPWVGQQIGGSGDDRAGGAVVDAAGGSTVAVNAGATLAGTEHLGGLDVVLQRRAADGSLVWSHVIGTAANDRAYGVVEGLDGGTVVAGYTRGDLDGAHPTGASDDAFVAAVSADGQRRWTVQLGDAGAADRIYAVASDGEGGAYVTGYTSGSLAGSANAGDKDAVLAHVSSDGVVDRVHQLGGAGEDKGLAVAPAPDGGVYVAGIAGAAFPGADHGGAGDAWIARYAADGTRQWFEQFGTAGNEQVSGLVARPDGSVVAIGHTKGALGAASLGDNDVFARAFAPDGSELWVTQTGTATDDRGIAGVAGADGSVLVVGATYGAMAEAVGGVDVFTLRLEADGSLGPVSQLGSVERDGADEWDDPNLFAVAGPSGMVTLTGVTFGATDGSTNAGAGDVFLTVVPYPAADGGAGEPEPTPDPTTPPRGTDRACLNKNPPPFCD